MKRKGKQSEPPAGPAKPFRDVYDWRAKIEENASRQRERFGEIRDEDFWRLYDQCKPYSMVGVVGFYNLWQSVHYLVRNRIPGGLVECGSFLGGASIFMFLLARRLGDERPIHVFDTFSGFPPESFDVRRGRGELKGPSYENFRESVCANFEREVGDLRQVRLIEGDVVRTLHEVDTGPVSLLRLDTDFYQSTKVELEVLYPRVSPSGVLIVDDYGIWEGSRHATDEYFAEHPEPPMLNRLNDAVWAGTKPGG